MRTRKRKSLFELRSVEEVYPDETNPRKPDPVRLHLLRLSLSKLGFILPISITKEGMVLSGHQRLSVAKDLGWSHVPVQVVELPEKDIKGINILFNRVTNDFGALDTGGAAFTEAGLSGIIERAEQLQDIAPYTAESDTDESWFAINCKIQSIVNLGRDHSSKYDKKAIVVAENFIRKDIKIPIVVSESGDVVNGIHRLFAARENGITQWPIVTIPDALADFALHFLNYLSMDYDVDSDFAKVLRYSAYRRPQNNRGSVPKAYRFWGNGERTLPDKDSYTRDYWRNFRDIHGHNMIDFGSGLSKVAPFLQTKGINCIDFEPYRINPEGLNKTPDPDYSRRKAREFLKAVEDPRLCFDSIFLASVLNSVPFPQDRMAVLAIVHGLCSYSSTIYGTCRDISDFHYEYGGIRQANYFVFDSEPGVRLGDALHNPKIQKFHTQDEIDQHLAHFWNTRDYWKGGNIFYFRAKNPKRRNLDVLSKALEMEFDLPYKDGTTMGLVEAAKEAFSKRFKTKFD